MTLRELLIGEINHAPEDVLQVTLRYLRAELRRRRLPQHDQMTQTTGPYADYWSQFVGTFVGEEWERPIQGVLEQRESW